MAGFERSGPARRPPRAPKVGLAPAQYLILSYLGVLSLGATLLMLPQATLDGQALTWIDALFTATSALCVTGLTVVNTAYDLSLFGQSVLLGLIQIGALGIMTMSTFFLLLLRRRVRLQDRIFLQHDLNQSLLSGLVRLVRRVVVVTLTLEAVGAIMMYVSWQGHFEDTGQALYFAVFHSVSAFANAGFDLFGNSMEGMAYNFPATFGLGILFVLGGLGFSVLEDLRLYPVTRALTLHSRVVLTMSVGLLAVGALIVLALEWNNPQTLGSQQLLNRLWHAIFLSGTTRTAGFSTVPTAALSEATLFVLMGFMFIGASPGSTGGGIKTTTVATLLACIKATVRGRRDVQVFDRRLPMDAVSKALTITLMAIAILGVAVLALTLTEETPFLATLFEAVSAFGTVGLSTGITPGLSDSGKIILVLLMLVGRVGTMTFALALGGRRQESQRYRYPQERLPLG